VHRKQRPPARRARQADGSRPDEDHRLSPGQPDRRLEERRAHRAPAGGSCYNCHQLSPQEASYGTLGPSLLRFGATRGNGPEMQRYVYGKIYNAKAYNLCSQMPRLGHSGTLTPEQIKDLVGLLLDPASPVNK
jgi:sulfur-oxidizing protein SoxX